MVRKSLKKILVPLDGSRNSLRGLDEAIYIAKQCNATITGLYVIPMYPRNLADILMPYQIHLKDDAKKFMERAKERCTKKGVSFISKIDIGSPTSEIEYLSKEKKFDLIVIGSRGQSGLKEVFLGSVANNIVHKSKVPVLVVK